MPFITFEAPNLWEEACYEVQTGSPEIPLPPGGFKYNPAVYSPIFAGYSYHQIKHSDVPLAKEFDSCCAHPSTVGYSMKVLTADERVLIDESKLEESETTGSAKRKPSSPAECTAVQYLTTYLLKTVSAALEAMLVQAKKERCFERKRTKFNACDFLTEYMYKNNPLVSEEERQRRSTIDLFEIPFAREWLQDHPRKPLPKSLVWTDDEAATVLQASWRGYLLRRDPEVQELCKWQREWREENRRVLDGEIDKLFSRAQSQASSVQSPRSRPSSKRLSAQRRRSSSRRQQPPSNSSTISENIVNDGVVPNAPTLNNNAPPSPF